MKEDVQNLLKKVKVHTKFPLHKPKKIAGVLDSYTEAYPDKLMGKLSIKLKNGKEFSLEKEDYYGFFTRPMSWDDVQKKFDRLTEKRIDKTLRENIIGTIMDLEKKSMSELIVLLEKAGEEKKSIIKQMNKHKKAE